MLQLLQAIPFFLCVIGHTYLLLKQVETTTRTSGVPEIQWPIIAVLVGCIIDNIRLALGSILGASSVSKFLAQIAYFFHLVILPTLFITLASFLQRIFFYNERVTRTALPVGFIVATVFALDGLNIFYSKVCSNLILDESTGVARYTLNPKKKPAHFLLPVIVLSVLLVLLGACKWFSQSHADTFWVQLFCFVGQAMTPALVTKRWLMQAMNPFEIVTLWSLSSLAVDLDYSG